MAIDNFLTEKEIKIIKLIAENKSNYQIAKELKLTMYTVGNYITSMLKMFGCKNRYDLVEKFNQIENDPYFKGLTIEKIIELAKKSIRVTTKNRQLEDKLEKIKFKIKDLKNDLCDNCGWRNTDNCEPKDYVCGDLFEMLSIIEEKEDETDMDSNLE